MAGKPDPSKTNAPAAGKPEAKPSNENPTRQEQRRTDWLIIKRLMSNVWPKNDWRTRATVLLGFVLLISAKVCRCGFS